MIGIGLLGSACFRDTIHDNQSDGMARDAGQITDSDRQMFLVCYTLSINSRTNSQFAVKRILKDALFPLQIRKCIHTDVIK